MKQAIAEAEHGIEKNHGGPFGSVVVRDDKIVGSGHNMVLSNNDSTAHGEISAIRDAEKNLKTFDLSGCDLYTTGEPCPMCLGAILWANVERVYYGCTLKDNEMIGFRDDVFNELLSIDRSRLYASGKVAELDRQACLALFRRYLTLNPKNY